MEGIPISMREDSPALNHNGLGSALARVMVPLAMRWGPAVASVWNRWRAPNWVPPSARRMRVSPGEAGWVNFIWAAAR